MNNKLKKKLIITGAILAALVLLIFLIVPYVVSAVIYDGVFGERFTTVEYLRFNVSDFEGLQAERYEFQSNNNQTLVGYRYFTQDTLPRGVVVIAHGFGGGGHNSYMDVAYYFARNGYSVFAYDATGNDESQGDGVNGLPQGVIDLHYALEFVKEIDALKDLPVMLWGHSWGGYCVSAVLSWHPEVKAIAAIAGFDRSSDLIEAQGQQMVGTFVKALMPYVKSIERIKFGKFASATALKGFANSNASIFVAHSNDDDVVPIEYGYDKYYPTYSDNSRFQFVRFEDKGHTNILYSEEYINYLKDFNEKASQFFEGRTPTYEEKVEYITSNLDRSLYCDGLDKQLFAQILEFYNASL